DANEQQEKASLAMAQATQRLATHGAERQRLDDALAALKTDDALLSAATEIEVLEGMRHRCAQHQDALTRYQTQATQAWQDIKEIARALPWGDDAMDLPDSCPETSSSVVLLALRRRLPTLPARKQLEHLIRHRADLDTNIGHTQRSLTLRENEVASL